MVVLHHTKFPVRVHMSNFQGPVHQLNQGFPKHMMVTRLQARLLESAHIHVRILTMDHPVPLAHMVRWIIPFIRLRAHRLHLPLILITKWSLIAQTPLRSHSRFGIINPLLGHR